MIDFNSKAGSIKHSDINFSKIYATQQNALNDINNVKVSEKNASWNTDKMTYKILDDNQTVMISNDGVPIGFTTVDALEGMSQDGATVPAEKIEIADSNYINTMDETIDDTGSSISQEEAPAQELTPEYNEEPAEVVEEHNQPLNSGEEAPVETQELTQEYNEEPAEVVEETTTETPVEEETTTEITAEVPEEVAEEVKAETQQPPDPEVNVDTLELESSVEQSVSTEFNASALDPNSSLYKKLGGNTANLDLMISWLKANGFNDVQISGIIANSAAESGLTLDAQNPKSTAHGLFQWLDERWPSSWDLDSQMNHMMVEYTSTRKDRHGVPVIDHYGSVSTPEEAAKIWCTYFEGYTGWIGDREQYAKDCYNYIRGN